VHRHQIEDAVSATRAAIEEGTVAGGGVALIEAEEAIDVDSLGLSDDEATGALIVRRSLQEPARLIAGNAGFEGAVVVERIRGEVDAMGLNAATGAWGAAAEAEPHVAGLVQAPRGHQPKSGACVRGVARRRPIDGSVTS
jgi:chaperonin GroEL (HSP60 family)